jgi:hypothetical protein
LLLFERFVRTKVKEPIMSQFIESLESRSLFSAAPHVKAAPTPTQVADLQTIADLRAMYAQDLANRTQTIRTDLAAIPVTRADDLATIRVDLAKVRTDRGNPPLVAADLAQVRADRVKLVADVHTLQVQHITNVRSANAQLVSDRAMLSAAIVKYRADVIHHV